MLPFVSPGLTSWLQIFWSVSRLPISLKTWMTGSTETPSAGGGIWDEREAEIKGSMCYFLADRRYINIHHERSSLERYEDEQEKWGVLVMLDNKMISKKIQTDTSIIRKRTRLKWPLCLTPAKLQVCMWCTTKRCDILSNISTNLSNIASLNF